MRTETWHVNGANITVDIPDKFTKAEYDAALAEASMIERDDWRLSRLAKLKTAFARSNCPVNVGDILTLRDGTECVVTGFSCGRYDDYPHLTIAIKVGNRYGITVPDRIKKINERKCRYNIN